MPRVNKAQIGLLVLGAALLAAAASTGSGASTAAVAGEVPPDDEYVIPPDDDYGAGAAGCAVTESSVTRPPTFAAAFPGWIAQNGLWVNVGEKSTIAGTASGYGQPTDTLGGKVTPNGAIGTKSAVFRDHRAWGLLRVRGRRLPGRPGSKRLRSFYSNHLGRKSKVVPGAMVFPREGCWRIKARSGKARLVAVVWVVILAEA